MRFGTAARPRLHCCFDRLDIRRRRPFARAHGEDWPQSGLVL